MPSHLKIGFLDLPSRVVLAPMAGVTDLPFRTMVRKFGTFLTFSEMMPGREMLAAHSRMKRTNEDFANQHPIAAQIAGCDPDIMAEAARMQSGRGADLIDINMGCPAKKIVRGEAGAALMKDLPLARRIIEAVMSASSVPVTVKMRLGWTPDTQNAAELAHIAEDCGVSAITVHGRTRSQFYGGKADWAAIGRIKASVSIPVIGNGDVTSGPDALKMMEDAGVDAVMVGRAACGRPWLLAHIHAYLEEGILPPLPDMETRRALLLEHYAAIIAHYGARVGVPLARKHLAWGLADFPGAARLRAEIMRLNDPAEVAARIANLDFPNSL